MKISRIRIYDLNLEFCEPVKISYTVWNRVDNLLVVIETDTDLTGYGEAAPFKLITGDTKSNSLQSLRSLGKAVIGEDPSDLEHIHSLFRTASLDLGFFSMTAITAIDSACYDIIGKTLGKPIYQVLGSNEPKLIPNTITIYLGTVDVAEKTRYLLTRYRKEGLSRIKLKLSGNPVLDLKRVLSVARIHSGKLTLDANQAYLNPESAIELFNNIHDELGSQVVLIEEPCAKGDISKLKRVTEESKIPVFADESAATLEDIERIVVLKAAKGINIKLQKIGGIYQGIKAARLASANNLDIMIGCLMESGVGIAAGANFASGIENVSDTDLDTDLELRSDIVLEESKLAFAYGARLPSGKAGLGIELKELTTNPITTIT